MPICGGNWNNTSNAGVFNVNLNNPRTNATIAEVMDGQSKIIQLQTKLIDRLALALLQYGTIEDEELAMIKEAADLQKGLEE